MKKITLLNPESAQQIFINNGWTDEAEYFIHVETDESELMLNTTETNPCLHGNLLNIKFGSSYIIQLEHFENEITLELKDINELGALLYINANPHFLRVYRTAPESKILQISKLFPDLEIIDFGSGKNEGVKNLNGISNCFNLQTLNLDNCQNLEDISGLKQLNKLTTLWLDGFADASQFHYMSSCKTLRNISHNSSQLINIQHFSELPLLEILWVSGNPTVSDLNPIAEIKTLNRLSLNGNDSITDLKPISGLIALQHLDLSFCENISNLNEISGLNALNHLNLKLCKVLSDLSALANLSELTTLNLFGCRNLIDISKISELARLKHLELESCTNLSDIRPLSALKQLKQLNIGSCNKIRDLTPISELKLLNNLNLSYCENINDLSVFSELSSLQTLKLAGANSEANLSTISKLNGLIDLDLSGSDSVSDLNMISGLNYLESLNLNWCNNISNLAPLSGLNSLKHLSLACCKNIIDLAPLSGIKSLRHLNLDGCEIKDLNHLSGLNRLKKISLTNCYNLTRLKQITLLPELSEIDLEGCPHIRDFEELSSLKNLSVLTWIDPNACAKIVMKCAISRNDVFLISSRAYLFFKGLGLSKNAKEFALDILHCLKILPIAQTYKLLSDLTTPMRSRGLQSEFKNDLDAYTWETWCNLALELEKVDALSSLFAAVNDLDTVREAEVILGPVIVATSKMIEKYPEEKDNLINWVNEQLHLLEGHTEEQRQIAPSAAVFFASLNKKDDVLYWLQKATDEKAPLWRERVLKALIKHYAEHENFSEARRLLDEMQIQDEKDMAIASLAKAMATKHPVDAGFLLNDIHDAGISIEAARTLLSQPSMLREPQGIYQLLLHLQSNPDELAETLEKLIELDPEGKITDAVKQLFLQPQVTGPSASVLLELCKHPAIADFVKPRALEKYKNQLQAEVEIELAHSVPLLIARLQKDDLLDEEEAQELTQLLQNQ